MSICEMCSEDRNEMAILPIHQENGNLNTIACLDCAEQSGAYCVEHHTPHLGFFDGTSACRDCIEGIVQGNGEKIAGIFAASVASSEKAGEIQAAINEWLDDLYEATHNVTLGDLQLAVLVDRTPHSLNISRAIITRAQRMHMTPEEVIDQVCLEGPEVILPRYPFI